MARDPVLTLSERGLFCPAGGFFIDPWRPVDRAVITHAHSDHARAGHRHYLATPGTAAVVRQRLGPVTLQALPYDTPLRIGDATVSLHPAGHLPGSAQVRVEVGGEVWVVSGDYKPEADGLAEPFAPVRCHTFITECTFGLPVFRWQPQAEVIAVITGWWQDVAQRGETAVIAAYALGKAQRLIAALAGRGPGPVLTHGAVEDTNATLRAAGYALPATQRVTPAMDAQSHPGALIVAPPGALAGGCAQRFGPLAPAMASGWMALRATRRRSGAAQGFVLSDHADWDGLNTAIRETGAARVLTTHGYTTAFARWLAECGLDAGVLGGVPGGGAATRPQEHPDDSPTRGRGATSGGDAKDSGGATEGRDDGAPEDPAAGTRPHPGARPAARHSDIRGDPQLARMSPPGSGDCGLARFAALLTALEQVADEGARTEALAFYLRGVSGADGIGAIGLLSARRPRRVATLAELRDWAATAAALPDWLLAECRTVSGDLAETVAQALPPPARPAGHSLHWHLGQLAALAGAAPDIRRAAILTAWQALSPPARLVLNRLASGTFRSALPVGVLARALAQATGGDAASLARGLAGSWDPATTTPGDLLAHGLAPAVALPFVPYRAATVQTAARLPGLAGAAKEWRAEWHRDGLRAQLVTGGGRLDLWSAAGDPVTDRFPELAPLAGMLPADTVIDGELLVRDPATGGLQGQPAVTARLGGRSLRRRLLTEAPAQFVACDLLRLSGDDLRAQPLADRLARLRRLIDTLPAQPMAGASLTLPPPLPLSDWAGMAALQAQGRAAGAAGLLLRRLAAPCPDAADDSWWIWPLDPQSLRAVLVYAQAGTAGPLGDWTFALRDGNDLVPVARVSPAGDGQDGLADAEISEIARWIRGHTLERFGPVRRVAAELVFEIGFEAVRPSARHRSGLALQAPRILGWARGATVDAIDVLEVLRARLPGG